jgi:hypothetical protein
VTALVRAAKANRDLMLSHFRPEPQFQIPWHRQADHGRPVLVAQPVVVDPHPPRELGGRLSLNLDMQKQPLTSRPQGGEITADQTLCPTHSIVGVS